MKKKKVKSPWALAGFPIYIIGFSLLLAGGAPEWLETVSKIMIALGIIWLIIAGMILKNEKNQYKPKKLPFGSFFIWRKGNKITR
ncbi:hypothetical protein [Priestia megaterium]|uniref:hypothetical protein n=1 Tax=Priestia megaterium TaxID=1404 RepID=UPI000A5C0850|nr:hypothetical protein [Priestia megaterium]